LIARVERRRGDASDADRRVVREQLGYDLGNISWHVVDASGTVAQSADEAQRVLAAAAIKPAE
jgi:predicted kinase